MKFRSSPKSWGIAGASLIVVGVGAAVGLGVRYVHESDYWLVGLPTIATAVGTLALAGATFRLIQRGSEERSDTLEALKHSQTIADQSQRSALEAARHRRDDRARLLRLTRWQNPRSFLRGTQDHETVQDGKTFDLPRDANLLLIVGQAFEVLPADGHPMMAGFNGLTIGGEQHIGMASISVPLPGLSGPSFAWFMVRRTVAEWVTIAEQRATGEANPESQAWISVDDTFDDGVIDSYELVQGGCPLKKSSEIDGRWTLDALGQEENGLPRVVFKKKPMLRTYYVSKQNNSQLD